MGLIVAWGSICTIAFSADFNISCHLAVSKSTQEKAEKIKNKMKMKKKFDWCFLCTFASIHHWCPE